MSEPHTIAPPMGTLILKPSDASRKALVALAKLRAGEDVVIDCLETLDAILQSLTSLEEHCFLINALGKTLDVGVVKRMRFERGLDIRPRAEDQRAVRVPNFGAPYGGKLHIPTSREFMQSIANSHVNEESLAKHDASNG